MTGCVALASSSLGPRITHPDASTPPSSSCTSATPGAADSMPNASCSIVESPSRWPTTTPWSPRWDSPTIPRPVNRLVEGILASLVGDPGPPRSVVLPAHAPPPALMSPRDAFFADYEVVATDDAIGRISAELIAPYPPGVPVLVPGEEITSQALEALYQIAASRQPDRLRRGSHARDAARRQVTTAAVVELIPVRRRWCVLGGCGRGRARCLGWFRGGWSSAVRSSGGVRRSSGRRV